MKPHIRIVFRHEVDDVSQNIPDWIRLIQALRGSQNLLPEYSAPSHIHPAVDRLMRKFNCPFIATHEFSPAAHSWQNDERGAGLNRVYRLILKRNQLIPEALIRAIQLIPEVISATPMQMFRVPMSPRQPVFAQSRNTDHDSRDAIFLKDAHRFSQGHEDITVAVLDTGVQTDHAELRHAMKSGMDFVNIIDGAEEFIGDYLQADSDPDDDVGHGTHVAGIIAARGRRMPLGVVPRCKILPVRVLAAMKQQGDPVGAGLIENIDAGIKWAVDQGADVINMSLGVLHEGGGLPHQAVVDYARRKGVTIVAASGNDGQENLYYPGAFPHVIAVGASHPRRHVSAFSSFGSHVSCVAPGENIYSTHINQGYRFLTGTSHAAPFVAGAVALLKSFARDQGQSLSDGQVKYVLKHSCDKFGTAFKDRKAGYGQLNLLDALKLLKFKMTHQSRAFGSVQRSNLNQTQLSSNSHHHGAHSNARNSNTTDRIEITEGDCYV